MNHCLLLTALMGWALNTHCHSDQEEPPHPEITTASSQESEDNSNLEQLLNQEFGDNLPEITYEDILEGTDPEALLKEIDEEPGKIAKILRFIEPLLLKFIDLPYIGDFSLVVFIKLRDLYDTLSEYLQSSTEQKPAPTPTDQHEL
jgi:hypothetical protein